MNTLQQRIVNTRKAAGLTQSQLAAKAGLSQSTVAQIETGRNTGTKFAAQLAEALDVSVDWLLTGMQSGRVITKFPSGAVQEMLESDILGESRKGRYIDLSRPFYVEGEPVEWDLVEKSVTKFSDSFFQFHRVSRASCRLIEAQGADMEPYLFPSEWVLIDTAETAIHGGHIYAFLLPSNACLIRQAQLLLNGGFSFKAFNPNFPSFEVKGDQIDGLTVLGKVVYRSGRQTYPD